MSTTTATPSAAVEPIFNTKPRGLWSTALRRLFHRRSAIIGMIILGSLILIAIFAPVLATHDPTKSLIGIEDVQKRAAPCIHLLGCPADQPQHFFGLDGNVRDLYSRILYGSRLSLMVGIISVGFAIVIGATLGAISGYMGGYTDNLVMGFMDILLAFPSLILAIAIVTVLGPGLINTLLAIGIVSIPVYARIMRSSVLSIKQQDYVMADRSIGVPSGRILFGNILPNALTPLVVQGTLGIAVAILDAAALSFLGLGAQPPTPEWGSMIGQERNQVFTAPHLIIFPGIALILTVLGFNLLGDGLRDALDVRQRS
ncbi:MAG: ABC transporter permease [Caldilinea sp.]|nr:ABC transporter permease [Caldilinea sp.]MCB0040054.1 ABC transporter permease [Caldilinea sp.]MCB9113400.1 ABC transporter permease [Caldilineaceae bacterium]MCO5210917.1 ABC transporter permease [Caldilinea sp.]